MRERLELLVNLWTFGTPVVLLTWALLRLTANARQAISEGKFLEFKESFTRRYTQAKSE